MAVFTFAYLIPMQHLADSNFVAPGGLIHTGISCSWWTVISILFKAQPSPFPNQDTVDCALGVR